MVSLLSIHRRKVYFWQFQMLSEWHILWRMLREQITHCKGLIILPRISCEDKEFLVMTLDRNTREPKKEWREPLLRKLPIAATSTGKPTVGHNDGGGAKTGSAGANS